MAYQWDNYLLSCLVCNQKWKKAYFPVTDDPREIPPKENVVEQPLILNPYDDENPADHLDFGRDGEVEPQNGSQQGEATINICGLDRPSLRQARSWTAQDIYRLVQEYIDAETEEDENRALQDIYRKGQPVAHYPGVVRCIFETVLEMSWSELEELFSP